MDQNLFKLKVSCLFHDPTIKPLVWKVNKSHEEVAKRIIKILNCRLSSVNLNLDISNDEEEIIKHADWVAASSDRFIITELYDSSKFGSVLREIYSVNILDMSAKNLDEKISLFPNWLENYPTNFVDNLFHTDKINISQLHILYHIVWRFLIEATVKSLNNKEVSLLPADTRVPYYTIFDHLYTTSGFVVALKDDREKGKIGMIHWESIGVQSFIQESRALRDLWASSFLVSLLNTAVIIRLAKEYGFDSILSPNMLYNPLVDLYLYAHTNDERLKIEFNTLKVPTTPDKGFAIVPYDKVNEYVRCIPEWFNELWNKIVNEIKCYVEEEIDYDDIYRESLSKKWELNIDKLIFIENDGHKSDNNYWNRIWELTSHIPINFVCVGESFTLNEEEIKEKINNEWNKLHELDDNIEKDLETLRKVAKSKYPSAENFQFFEFPIIMEVLKKKRKLISENPRPDVAEWVLDNKIYVKDRRLICNICYKRPAVIFADDKVREKLPMIKEDERLCTACLTKRLLATKKVFIRVLSVVYAFADDSKSDGYKSIIEKIIGEYANNPLLIPSLVTVSTLTFRSSVLRSLRSDLISNYECALNDLVKDNYTMLYINAPDISWLESIDFQKNNISLLLICGGEFFLIEELKKTYKEKNKEIDELKELLGKISDDLCEYNYNVRNDFTFVKQPGKYVSIIRADGDNMGKLFTLSGNYKRKIGEILPAQLEKYQKHNGETLDGNISLECIKGIEYRVTPSFYAFTSRALSIIARKIAEIANKYATIIVYAGGDDILAVSPTELSLLFAKEAREIFSKSLLEINNSKGVKIEISGLGSKATQSFAIRYFHVFDPLSKELRESNEDLENKAKEILENKEKEIKDLENKEKEKNGLVITYKARSGSQVSSILKWEYKSIVERIWSIVSLTLKYKRIYNQFGTLTNINEQNARLSDKSFRDIIALVGSDRYNKDLLDTIIEKELKSHSSNLDNQLMLIISCLDGEAVINNEKNIKKYPALLEFMKAALAFQSALDSKPLALGVKL